MTSIAFEHSFAQELPGLFTHWQPARVAEPRFVFFNAALAQELGLDARELAGADGLALLAGNALPATGRPIAQAYAGHQFGAYSPQLGDGRALLLGEVVTAQGERYDIALKGSGRTPYARGGDGRAALGPMLREVLLGEFMHAAGIPTTRALAVVATGEAVWRDRALPGAVLTRVAASHLRVGTFEFAAATGDLALLERLADYALARHYPGLAHAPDRALALLQAVAERQADLVAQWMNVGFIHGVMNTDNMAISGQTIDYGPCAFLEAYDPGAVFSSIDERGRYAYGNQPAIAQWNLARLAEALLPLAAGPDGAGMDKAIGAATEVLERFVERYTTALQAGMQRKLGLAGMRDTPRAAGLADQWLDLLRAHQVDFTLAWRRLADAAEGDAQPLRALFADPRAPDAWLVRWQACCQGVDDENGITGAAAGAARARAMRQANPLVIPRNQRVEEALDAATDAGDLEPFERLLAALRDPYGDMPGHADLAQGAPPSFTATYRTFCGT